MIRSYQYPLKPNRTQEVALQVTLLACQRLYNGALEERREAYRRQRHTVTKYDQHKELTTLRAEDPDYGHIAARILRSPITRLDRAYQAFFRRVKAGEKPGFPRFKSRDRYNGFDFPKPSIKGDRVLVPNLGYVKLNLYRPLPIGAVIKDAKVNKTPKGWEVSFSCDVGPAPETQVDPTKIVGLDLGLKSFLVLSDGQEVQNPRFFRLGQDILARRQRRLQTKRRGSKSRGRAKTLVGQAHRHVHNQRLDFSRKLAKDLVSRYDVICHEDLNIRGMVYGTLAKSINDAGWGLFIRCLASKAEEAGKLTIPVNPRGTSQRCSGCQTVVPKGLAERTHSCPSCGLTLDRDHNAAINIKALGLSVAQDILSKGQPEPNITTLGASQRL